MKKITLTLFTALLSLASVAQVNTVVNVPTPNTAPGTTGLRAPNGTAGHTVMRGQYFISAADLSALSPTITSFGFALTSGVASAANGTLTVYLQHTGATSYTAGTTWGTAGMTTIYTGSYAIPVGSAAANVDLTLPSAFSYTGGALNIAYEYTAAVTATNAAVYTAFAGSALGATGASSTTATAPVLGGTGFRPVFRFGTPNTYTNEIIVQSVGAAGKYPTTFGSPQVITAQIMNGSNIAKTNIAVGLSVTGVNTFTNAQFIGALAAGAVTTVTFAPMTSTVQGINTISVGVLPDQNNINNNITVTQSITCDFWAYNPPTGTYTSGVGFNTGSGIISSNFVTPVSATCIAVSIGISSDVNTPGNPAVGVLMNATGSIIATTNTITLTTGMLSTAQTLVFASPVSITAGVNYYVGYLQTANPTGYFPLGSQAVLNTPNNYFTSPVAGNSLTPLTSNLGYFKIEPAFTSTCGSVGIAELVSTPKVTIYPNPTVNGKATIAGLEGANTITVYNMLGQQVMNFTSDKEVVSIDLVNQPMGNYLVKITNSSNGTKTVKIINQ
ncbi:MAG: T9SS type A sorting domain-containing protein [Bacteroidota bacterium]|nr:T9SS type A sorting domain-containing protein [Bacteroidota bacterium]MDP3145918.1 T9SS type A sorting domain-containing protein [Bacteroidota bacterium]